MANDGDVFERHAGIIPADFLRALAYCESGYRANVVNRASGATGLFQITAPVLADYNRASGTNHVLTDLFDTELAARVAIFHIGQILAHWQDTPALKADFTDRRFVELLVFGWNVGANAVFKIVRRLTDLGVAPERITAQSVWEAAKVVAPGTFVARQDRLAFARLVAATYFGEHAEKRRLVAKVQTDGPGLTTPAVIAALGVGAAVVAQHAGEGA